MSACTALARLSLPSGRQFLLMALALLFLFGLPQSCSSEVIISESSEPTGTNRDTLFFECRSVYCENNKKIRYWWVYDEIVKYRRKYRDFGHFSYLSRLAITLGSFRRIFNEKAVLGFYVVRKVKGRKILEIGPMQSEYTPPAFVELGQGPIGRAWQTKQTVIIQDITQVPDHMLLNPDSKAEFIYPVLDPYYKNVTAVFVMGSKTGDHFETIDTLGIRVVMDAMEIL